MPTAGGARKYRIDLFSQRLYCGSDALSPTKREFELLAFLAFCDRSVSKDELAEIFAPESTSQAADAVIRVTIARIRKKYGDGLIVSERGGYRLGRDVDHTLRAISARIANCRARSAISPENVEHLRADAVEIERYFAGGRPAYEFGVDLDCVLEEFLALIREIEDAAPLPRPPERRRGRIVMTAVAFSLIAIIGCAALVLGTWRTLEARDKVALAQMLASQGFRREAKMCAAMRRRCIDVESAWLSQNVPKWSSITTPQVPYFYSVPSFSVRTCDLDFTKVYTALNSTAIIKASHESGPLTQVQQVFYAERDYGGNDRWHTRWRTFPTVILESYRPFTRVHLHRPPDEYKYIFFLFDSEHNAKEVMYHLQLLSLLCGSGPWAPV